MAPRDVLPGLLMAIFARSEPSSVISERWAYARESVLPPRPDIGGGMSALALIMSALPPIADVNGCAGLSLLLTQAV